MLQKELNDTKNLQAQDFQSRIRRLAAEQIENEEKKLQCWEELSHALVT